jgi:glycosyltransferase involved in cell wall biosynthesis
MRTKEIVFCQSVTGHYLEYLNHLYVGRLKDKTETVFVVPVGFETQKVLFDWPQTDRISFDLIEFDIWSVGWLMRSFRLTMLLKKTVKKHKADSVFLVDIDLFMPILPFLFKSKEKISGILYGIYLYRWKESNLLRKIYYVITHLLYAKYKIFDTVFVLNDRAAPRIFNRLFHTERFVFLPDPFVSIKYEFEDFRKKYDIQSNQKIFLHFGSMGKRKGTLLILESILELTPEESANYVFVFAGIIQDTIKDDFNKLTSLIGESNRLLIFNQFCNFEFLANWCKSCDAILIPYLTSYGSSGLIGYAAQFHKPVITNAVGMIGKLVRKFHLGITVRKLDTTDLVKAYRLTEEWFGCDNRYLMYNSVEQFNTVINGRLFIKDIEYRGV